MQGLVATVQAVAGSTQLPFSGLFISQKKKL
uniref:Uncharacterized protein n=1 Tax=Anguilla anguilla TaxID=7936 RepID=A0A0E9WAZ5_ANGAN